MERTAFLSICATGKTWGLGSAGVLDFLCCFAKVPFVRLQVRDITRYGRVGMQSLITTVASLHVKWSYRGKFVLLSFNPKWMMPIVLELSGLFQWSAIPQSHYLNSAFKDTPLFLSCFLMLSIFPNHCKRCVLAMNVKKCIAKMPLKKKKVTCCEVLLFLN